MDFESIASANSATPADAGSLGRIAWGIHPRGLLLAKGKKGPLTH